MGGDGAPLVLFRSLWVVVLDYLPGVLLGDRCTEKIWPHSFFHFYKISTSYFHLSFLHFSVFTSLSSLLGSQILKCAT